MKYDIVLLNANVFDSSCPDKTCRKNIGISDSSVHFLSEGEKNDSGIIIDLKDYDYVTPGLIDSHCHLFHRDCPDSNVLDCIIPDHHLFPAGVTTAVDAGTAGAANFDEFRNKVIDKSKVDVYAYLNISRNGMLDLNGENDVANLNVDEAVNKYNENQDKIIGFKSAHYWTTKPFDDAHPMWASVDNCVKAGTIANKRVMIDFYPNLPARTYPDMLKRMRKGDIHTHMYAQQFDIIDSNQKVKPYIKEARERGILFDVGHGACSFWFRNAIPAIKDGHIPFTISSDLYGDNVCGPVYSLLHVMNKFINIGMSVEDVFKTVTINAASIIGKPEIGSLYEGGNADISVFKLRREQHGFVDGGGASIIGDKYLECILTIKKGRIVYNPRALGMISLDHAPEEYFVSPGKIKY